MTPRQLDMLAAWWYGGGSNTSAAFLLGIKPQVMRNGMFHLRAAEGVQSNVDLVRRYMKELDARSHKISGRNSKHADESESSVTLRLSPRSQNISLGTPQRHVTSVYAQSPNVHSHCGRSAPAFAEALSLGARAGRVATRSAHGSPASVSRKLLPPGRGLSQSGLGGFRHATIGAGIRPSVVPLGLPHGRGV